MGHPQHENHISWVTWVTVSHGESRVTFLSEYVIRTINTKWVTWVTWVTTFSSHEFSNLYFYFHLSQDMTQMSRDSRDSNSHGGVFPRLSSFWRKRPVTHDDSRWLTRVVCFLDSVFVFGEDKSMFQCSICTAGSDHYNSKSRYRRWVIHDMKITSYEARESR